MTNIDKQLILKLISNLNPNKAHCHHGLSIRMYQKSSSFISKPLISIIFRYWPKTRREPQKGNNQILNIYWPVNLLLFYGKLFEKIIFNTIFEYLTESDFLNPNQPGLVILLCISLSHYRKWYFWRKCKWKWKLSLHHLQKQPSRAVLIKRYSENRQQI